MENKRSLAKQVSNRSLAKQVSKRNLADFVSKRKMMVNEIKVNYGFENSEILAVMLEVPRHKFVDRKNWNVAYSDGPVSIGYGQTMSQPFTVAFMTDLLNLEGNEKVLEIGTGSGYQAAVLSRLVEEVYTIEIVSELANKAQKTFKDLGYKNIFAKLGSGEWGWKDKSPFDAIIITAALEGEIPRDLVDQLKPGGVIVAPLGPRKSQVMTRLTKVSEGELEKEEFQDFVFVPFIKE